MADITSQDIQLFKSQVMADIPQGGGRMTGNVVVDGQLNNVFDDTSRDDRTNGRVSLRKLFGAVRTLNTEKFLGAGVMLSDPAGDGQVVCTLFTLNSPTSRRADAQTRVENYLLPGSVTLLTLHDAQPQGARIIVGYQQPDDPLPEVSEVLCLSIELVGHVNYGFQQFVRITGMSSTVVTIDVNANAYKKRIVTLEISEPLQVTFPGGDFVPQPSFSTRPTRVRKTNLSESANYYGVVPLADEIAAGNTDIKVETILQNVAPATYAETALLDQQVGGEGPILIPAGPEFTHTQPVTVTGGICTFKLLRAVRPGSLEIDLGVGASQAIFEAGADGVLERTGGGANTLTAAGTVNNQTGEVSLTGLVNGNHTATLTYIPAALSTDRQHTQGTAITLANRGFNYSFTLILKPGTGTVMVTYRALGRWYTLTDNGSGQLVGAPGTGAGTVNYLTGTVNVTLGYQPDVGSHVICAWRSNAHYRDQSGLTLDVLGAIVIQTATLPRPGTLSLTWSYASVDYEVTAAVDGVLSGHGTGTLLGQRIELRPTVLPPKGTVITVTYEDQAPEYYNPFPVPAPSGGTITFTISPGPIEPGSVVFFPTYGTGHQEFHPRFYDGGDGKIYQSGEPAHVGTINYTSGVTVIPAVRNRQNWELDNATGVWELTLDPVNLVDVGVSYQGTVGGSPITEPYTLNQLEVDVTPGIIAELLSGSLLFTLNGRHYYDNGVALQYRNGSADANAGGFDPATGQGYLTEWAPGAYAVTLHALLTRYGIWQTSSVIWRVPASPLRTSSFQITNGVTVAVANGSGNFSAGGISGNINNETGVYTANFSPPQDPATLRYNAVALSYLPTDPVLLGLNAVRLPLDGRVPVIAPGRTLIIHHTASELLPNPPIAGATYELDRGELAYAHVYDAEGELIPTDRFTADLDTGEVQMANPLDLSGFTLPLRVEHRIEDQVQCLDAQLSGDIKISGVITHDYPLGSYVSSKLRFGDLQAIASEPFDQLAWDGQWSDSQLGAPATGGYDNVNYPIEVTNLGAITGRYRFEFQTGTAFRCYEESLGLIGSGEIGVDFAPVNPAAGVPFFIIKALGWNGFAAGNVLRFNTVAAAADFWINRCTLQGPVTEPNDSVRVQFLGDHKL